MSGNFFDKMNKINPPASPVRLTPLGWRAGLSESDGGQARFSYFLYILNILLSCQNKGEKMSGKNIISMNNVVAQSEELVSSDLDGETVLMSIEKGKYYGMDAIGSRIWMLIEQPILVSELCDTLLKEFDVVREQCEQDVLAFLNQLARDNLAKVIDAAAK